MPENPDIREVEMVNKLNSLTTAVQGILDRAEADKQRVAGMNAFLDGGEKMIKDGVANRISRIDRIKRDADAARATLKELREILNAG